MIEEDKVVDDAGFEGAYDRWRDDCAMELCEAVDRLVGEVVRDKKSYFKDQQSEAWRCIEVHAKMRQVALDGK